MDPFEVMQQRGHILETESGFSRTTTHSGSHDDYDLSRGPSRSLTARSDKALTQRDLRMPGDLMRSRRVGLSRMVCKSCGATIDNSVCTHDASYYHGSGRTEFVRETTGPMLSNETSADVGWH